MDVYTAWDNLVHAISDMQRPDGDHKLKLATVMVGVELLFEFPVTEVLEQVQRSSLPTRAIVSWLVFEGGRLSDIDETSVKALRDLYETTSPPGEGIIPPPSTSAGGGIC
jgi:hypothetical protein